jgi:hypothetical protein
VEDALGYHDRYDRGIPFGIVFTALSQEMGEPWSVTLSHEALELIGDPEVNLLVAGAHPTEPERDVFHWYEMCDAVQAESYEIDGVMVSNFILPLYFTGGDEKGGRNDFLGRLHDGKALRSFGVNPGGYIGFFDPKKQDNDTFSREGDMRARARLEIKSTAKAARRAVRYQQYSFNGKTSVADAVETMTEGATEGNEKGRASAAAASSRASASSRGRAAKSSSGLSSGAGSKAGKSGGSAGGSARGRKKK